MVPEGKENKEKIEIKKPWVTPDFNILSTDGIKTGTTPGTKEFDDGLGHLYSS